VKSGEKRLRINAVATPVSMSAYAADRFVPIIPRVEPGREAALVGRLGL